MLRSKKWFLLVFLVAGLQLFVYQHWAESGPKKNGPAKVEPLSEGISRITLTPKAVERLDIQTAKITEDSVSFKGKNGGRTETRRIVPYSAVLYDPTGVAWAYTNPKPLVYVRKKLTIDFIDGDNAILIDGPPSGTEVVVIGATELYGEETGIGK